jgi:hypothetical protein
LKSTTEKLEQNQTNTLFALKQNKYTTYKKEIDSI